MQTPTLKVLAEWGWGIEWLAKVVHRRLGGVKVPQMWEFVLHIVVLAKLVPGPAVVADVVHKKL